MKFLYYTLIIAGITFFCFDLNAENAVVNPSYTQNGLIHEGMTFSQITRLLGSPVEKIEKEAKREDIWTFRESKLIFKEGRLRALMYNDIEMALSDEKLAETSSEDNLESEVTAVNGQADRRELVGVEEILEDIMKGNDKSPDSKDSQNLPLNAEIKTLIPGGPPPLIPSPIN